MYNIIALTVGQFLPLGISGLSEFIVSIKRIEVRVSACVDTFFEN